MRTILVAAVLAVLCAATARADVSIELKSAQFTIAIDARESANLIYQLDCLAELVHCAPDVFQAMWRDELKFDDADRQALEEWKRMRVAAQEHSVHEDPTLKVKASLPLLSGSDDNAWSRLQWAGNAADEALRDREWAKLMSADELTRLRAVLDHFKPRFHAWWQRNEATAESFVPQLEASLKKAHASELLILAAKFYGSDLGDGRVFIHLNVLPARPKRTNGFRMGPHLNVEIVPGENIDDRVSVVVHELEHHMFGCMPPERKAILLDRMMAAGAGAVPAWQLFDEVQATSIGNVLAARHAMSPESFLRMWNKARSLYSVDDIDRGARAVYPLIEKAFAEGGAMPESFPADYVRAMRQAAGLNLETTTRYLGWMAMIRLDDRDKELASATRMALHSSSVWGFDASEQAAFVDFVTQYPALSLLIFARPEQLASLAPGAVAIGTTPEELQRALGDARGMVFLARRSPAAYSFIVLARDDAAMAAAAKALEGCALQPGVCQRF